MSTGQKAQKQVQVEIEELQELIEYADWMEKNTVGDSKHSELLRKAMAKCKSACRQEKRQKEYELHEDQRIGSYHTRILEELGQGGRAS